MLTFQQEKVIPAALERDNHACLVTQEREVVVTPIYPLGNLGFVSLVPISSFVFNR
jgi:hypothetical protein